MILEIFTSHGDPMIFLVALQRVVRVYTSQAEKCHDVTVEISLRICHLTDLIL